jgi:hypothetical protein
MHEKDMQIAFQKQNFGCFFKDAKGIFNDDSPFRELLLESVFRTICSLTFTLGLWGIMSKGRNGYPLSL